MLFMPRTIATRLMMLSSLAALNVASASLAATQPAGVAAFVRDQHLAVYTVALTDLNNDGEPEALVYAMATTSAGNSADLCGSGGCDLYVLALSASGYHVVTDISVARPPVRVLSSISHGWHDLAVFVAGAGIIPGYTARLRFNGQSYPTNPTVPPATRAASVSGRQVIDKDAEIMPRSPRN